MRAIDSGKGTLLSVIRLYSMDVTSSVALNISGSPHQIISYLLKDEPRDFEFKSYS